MLYILPNVQKYSFSSEIRTGLVSSTLLLADWKTSFNEVSLFEVSFLLILLSIFLLLCLMSLKKFNKMIRLKTKFWISEGNVGKGTWKGAQTASGSWAQVVKGNGRIQELQRPNAVLRNRPEEVGLTFDCGCLRNLIIVYFNETLVNSISNCILI